MILFEIVNALVSARLADPLRAWWQSATKGPVERLRFLGAFSGAGRRLGRSEVAGDLPEVPRLAAHGLIVAGRPWAELGRVGLLLGLPGRVADQELIGLVEEAYRTGDLEEKQAVLRALAFLPQPSSYVAIAAEGARSNAMSIVEAITCDNPFPAQHFSTDALNQMTMKALFNGLPLLRIVGLQGRMNDDLVRMSRDYGRERRAAGRAISNDLAMLEQGSLSS
ncbi:MAG: EboA domain-containing protein [Deltaproteobacteria bacterium]|nr:EboA domain-containing protein [Deltaproteobacteria bacterium]